MTIERRQVKEALLLNKQNKEMQRFENDFRGFCMPFSLSHSSLVKLKEAERLHQEESLAERQISTANAISGFFLSKFFFISLYLFNGVFKIHHSSMLIVLIPNN